MVKSKIPFSVEEIKAAIKELDDQVAAENSLYEFFKQAWHVLEGNTEFVDEWYLRELSQTLEDCYYRKIKKLLINLPPRKGKSLLISVVFPVWVWLQNPEERLMCASYANSIALKIADDSRNLIRSDWFQRNWGDRIKIKKDQDSKSYFVNDKGGYRFTTSVGSFFSGVGFSIQICVPSHTMIQCETGDFSIGEIVNNKLPVKVLSYNHQTNSVEYKEIEQYYKHIGQELYEIEFDNGEILECTKDHPVFVENKGYVNVEDLQEGDVCLSHLQEKRTIKSIKRKGEIPDYVYNLEIKDNNNYFANNILVHNCDDPNDPDGESQAKLEQVIRWWGQRWFNRANDARTAVRIVVQQRAQSVDDVSGTIIKGDVNDEWFKVILPMEYEPGVKSNLKDHRTKPGQLLSNRDTPQTVAELKIAHGSYGYAAQYQQRPQPLSGGIIKKEWFRKLNYVTAPEYELVLQSYDTAFSDKQDANYSACTTWGIWRSPEDYEVKNITLLSMWRGRVGYPELRDRAKRLVKDYKDVGEHKNIHKALRKVDICLIEAKATGDPLIRDLRVAGIPAIPYLPKGDKTSRVQRVLPYIESGLVWLPTEEKDKDTFLPFAKEFVDSVITFPTNVDSRDLVDTLTQALSYIRDNVHLRHPEDEYEEPKQSKTKSRYY